MTYDVNEIFEFLKSTQVVIAISIVFVSSFATIFAAVINGIHSRKMKYMELYFDKCITAYQAYIESACNLICYDPSEKVNPMKLVTNFSFASMNAKLLSSPEVSEQIQLCGELLSDAISRTGNFGDVVFTPAINHFGDSVNQVIALLQKELKHMDPYSKNKRKRNKHLHYMDQY